MNRQVGSCLHNTSGICSHGKYMNYICVGHCEYYKELTQEMADSWNNKGYITLNGASLADEQDMQHKSFINKKLNSATLDLLAIKVDQDELYEFDKFLREQVEFGIISQEKYEFLYDKAYRHCK